MLTKLIENYTTLYETSYLSDSSIFLAQHMLLCARVTTDKPEKFQPFIPTMRFISTLPSFEIIQIYLTGL